MLVGPWPTAQYAHALRWHCHIGYHKQGILYDKLIMNVKFEPLTKDGCVVSIQGQENC
jgi:hypothetical protein